MKKQKEKWIRLFKNEKTVEDEEGSKTDVNGKKYNIIVKELSRREASKEEITRAKNLVKRLEKFAFSVK